MSLPLTGAGPSVGGSYIAKMLGYSPISYWVQGEASGTTALDQINSPAQDGTYTGVTLGQSGIGDGNTAPYYDGANDYLNVDSVAFETAFNGQQGSIVFWLDPDAWGAGGYLFRFLVDADNSLFAINEGPLDVLFRYEANTVVKDVRTGDIATTDFVCLGVTWDLVGDAMISYLSGAPVQTVNGLGTWAAGAFTLAVFGAFNTTPVSPYAGKMAQCAVFDRPLTAPEMADLAVV